MSPCASAFNMLGEALRGWQVLRYEVTEQASAVAEADLQDPWGIAPERGREITRRAAKGQAIALPMRIERALLC